MTRTNQSAQKGIAIISMAGRFPNAPDVGEYWQNLRSGLEALRHYSDEEILVPGATAEDAAMLKLPNYVKAGYFFDGYDMFDAGFFGFTPSEAELMDPQHRILLECAWEALENAGYDPESYEGRIGAYAGKGANQYNMFHIFRNPDLKHVGDMQIGVANEACFVATQLSYKLNLKGPSMTVQSACSSSLAAVCMASQALLTYQTDMALAGGVSIVPGKVGYLYREGGISSPDGHTRSFDAKAKGTVFGNGAGLVLLKRLADAIADGDQIFAVIKGYGINNDGSRKVGFTAPSVDGQAEVVAEALAMAGFGAESVGYIEAHGTGTAIGDPIEVAALTKAFRAYTRRKGFCGIGSVKSNIGHTDTASGVAGLIKASLALKEEFIPRTLHFESPNPQIDFANSPFYVVDKDQEWKRGDTPRRAGVSSFGIGGTNTHLIIEEAPPLEDSGESRPWQLLMLSAKTDSALDTMTTNLRKHLEAHSELNIADVAYTLQVGRRPFDYRRMLVCQDSGHACRQIEEQSPKIMTGVAEVEDPPLVFMFPGQGAQYVNMALELYRRDPKFREEVDRCSELLEPQLGFDLRDVLYPAPGKEQEATERLAQTNITQPAMFVIEYALAKLLNSWGLRPQAMIGHSIGEYTAACLAGVFTLEEALSLIVARSSLIWELPKGTMMAVNLPEAEVRSLISDDLAIAATNAPSLCVVSGPTAAFPAFTQSLARKGMSGRQLPTSHAFHSPMMEPMLDRFIAQVKTINLKPPAIPYISNVTGSWITDAEATDPNYWARHILETVRFADGAAELLKDRDRIFVEIGPGRTLQTFIKQNADAESQRVALSTLRHPKSSDSDLEFMLSTLGQLWLSGVKIQWTSLYEAERRRRVALPSYPFERQRYWIERAVNESTTNQAAPLSGGKKPDSSDWFYVPSWKRDTHTPGQFENWSQESNWLIFMDSCGIGEPIADQLRRHGQSVTEVRAGDSFAKLEEGRYTIRPNQREDYDKLFTELSGAGRKPQRIVHLFSLAEPSIAETSLDSFTKAQPLGFYSLLFLAQALGGAGLKDEVQIDVISNHVHEVTSDDHLQPEKATLLGPCRVIPQEYPNVACRNIDIVLPDSKTERNTLTDQLLNDLTRQRSNQAIAYRGSHRWLRLIEPVSVGSPSEESLTWRKQGVYLITGGMGGIGLALAEYLAENFQAKLVLLGRSHFPAREEWNRWVASHGSEDEVSKKIKTVLALEAFGSEVIALSANVANLEQMRGVIKQAHQQFGPIHGVIHSAGVPAGGVIQLKTPEMVTGTFSPKVDGTYVLDSLLKHEHLDFFVLCSSLAAELGGAGQVDYCAANAFQDSYAQHLTRRGGTRVVAIGWDKWEDVGMAVKARQTWPLHESASPDATTQNVNFLSVDHPILHKYSQQGNETTFVSELDAARHWILSEHSIYGTPTVEGTAYIEMIRAAFERLEATGQPEVKDLLFLTPFAVPKGEKREVRIVMDKGQSGYNFRVTSKFGENGHTTWQDHAMGHLSTAKPSEPKKHNVDEILARCNVKEITSFRHRDSGNGDNPITLGPRWKCTKKVNIGVDEGLSYLELPSEFCSDLDSYKVHPALLDIATSAGAFLIAQDAQSYLPFSYKRLIVKKPLTQKLYSHFRRRSSSGANEEMMTFDIVIMDHEGHELVEIEEFAVKRVGEAAAQELRARGERSVESLGQTPAVPAVGNGDVKDGILPKEGVEVFRRSLSASYLPQLIVSATDIDARIRQVAEQSQPGKVKTAEKGRETKSLHKRPKLRTAFVAPRNELETAIAAIWQSILGIQDIGVHDNFLELGGHSLSGIRMISRIREDIQVAIPIDAVFKSPTIAELAQTVVDTVSQEVDEETLAQAISEVRQQEIVLQ